MTIGTAITASQKFVCMVGKCSINAPRSESNCDTLLTYVKGFIRHKAMKNFK